MKILPAYREEYAAIVLNPAVHVQTTHRNQLDKLLTLSRQLVQAIWHRYKNCDHGRKAQDAPEGSETNKP